MDHYQLLGIKVTASKNEINKAYHRKARELHPDKNPDSNAAEKFRAVNKAYEVLKDEEKRKNYDKYDLPQAKAASARSQHSKSSHHHSRHRHDDRFFMSEQYSEEKLYQDKLDKIRQYNEDLLKRKIAELNREKSTSESTGSSSRQRGKHPTANSQRHSIGKILSHLNDDEFEKLVLDRLRALAQQQ